MPGLNHHFLLLQSYEEAAFCSGEKYGFNIKSSSSCLKPRFVYISKMIGYPCPLFKYRRSLESEKLSLTALEHEVSRYLGPN